LACKVKGNGRGGDRYGCRQAAEDQVKRLVRRLREHGTERYSVVEELDARPGHFLVATVASRTKGWAGDKRFARFAGSSRVMGHGGLIDGIHPHRDVLSDIE